MLLISAIFYRVTMHGAHVLILINSMTQLMVHEMPIMANST